MTEKACHRLHVLKPDLCVADETNKKVGICNTAFDQMTFLRYDARNSKTIPFFVSIPIVPPTQFMQN